MHEKQSNNPNLIRRVAPVAAMGVAVVSLFSYGDIHSKAPQHKITISPEATKNHSVSESTLTRERSVRFSLLLKEFTVHPSDHHPKQVPDTVHTPSPQQEGLAISPKFTQKPQSALETTTTTNPPTTTTTSPRPVYHSDGRESHVRRTLETIQPTVGNFWYGSPAIYHRHVGTAAENSNIALTYQISSQEGISNQEIACLDNVWGRESGFDNTASNPSGAGGIAQLDPDTNYINLPPAQQIIQGLVYIKNRYGSPCAAEQHWDIAAANDNGRGWY